MFIKASKFERLVKEAYKEGNLHIGCEDHHIMTSGTRWMIAMDRDEIPKELLAVLIKYAGRLPDEEECWLVTDEGLQSELPDAFMSMADLDDEEHEWHQIDPTGVLLEQKTKVYALYQRLFGSTRVIAVNALHTVVVDPGEIDMAGGERPVRGPFVDQGYTMIVWENDRMQFQIHGVKGRPDSSWAQLLEFFEQRCIRGIGE